MAVHRQDAWTEDEDLILAEIVLKHIREGSTQLSAFKEVGERLGRTAAACGFRWNSTVRKKYEESIALAKEQRKTHQSESGLSFNMLSELDKNMNLEDVISFLQKLATDEKRIHALEQENFKLRQELEETKKEYESKLKELTEVNEILKKDYKTMIEIMNRASKFVEEEDH
ncbi:RsfA family transcriptional regulator [Pueribacillus theae]|uniref:RsfA family transcriptional regulator n=1 Tax=Pueribacillus theae TaxID=2171751 RepID=A0A2U1K790_9BACI|nr:RsfA family transcriptional regulator [Pueribacillus theae]PWA13397.1 RsfA family transcriptional regulator [Pueribacillus theae]